MIHLRIRRLAAVGAATLMLLGIGGISARGEEPSLFGFTMGATSSGISFLYNQPSFGVPSDPTFELRKIYSTAEVDSGPSAHALGSVVWPGQVTGNAPPSLLFDVVIFNPTQIDQVWETCLPPEVTGGPIPVPTPLQCVGLNPTKQQLVEGTEGRSGYPIRAESFYPSDQPPTSSQEIAAGIGSQSEARENLANASATTGGAGMKGIISYGSIYSRSDSEIIKGVAVAKTVTHISNLDMFGAIHIDSLLATATATSNGLEGKTGGSLEIAGMKIYDGDGKQQLDIALDKSGFHIRTFDADGKAEDRVTQDPLGTIADQVINKYLGEQGFGLHVGEPIDLNSGASASRSLAGLTLHLDARGMKTMLDEIDKNDPGLDIKSTLQNPTSNHTISDPIFGEGALLNPYSAGLIASFFQGDQDMNIVFGGVAVSSAASPPLPEFPVPDIPIPSIDIPPPLTGGDLGGGFVQQPGQTLPNVQALSVQAVGSVGIPFAALVAILLAGLIGSSRMRLFADSVTSARAVVRCPMEELDK